MGGGGYLGGGGGGFAASGAFEGPGSGLESRVGLRV